MKKLLMILGLVANLFAKAHQKIATKQLSKSIYIVIAIMNIEEVKTEKLMIE